MRVKIGNICIGTGQPIKIQSMTDTDTADVDKTIEQIYRLAEAGSELIRVTVDREESASKVARIKQQMQARRVDIPLIGDFHYNGHILLKQNPQCAEALDKYRINPGNVGFGDKRDQRFGDIIEIALLYDKPVRIGVNWGSLDQQLLANMMNDNAEKANPQSASEVLHKAIIESVLMSAKLAEKIGMPPDKIVLSAKVSNVKSLIYIYRKLAAKSQYTLHLGLTEAGMGMQGIISSTAALSALLLDGIGDTIRISITPALGEMRTKEVEVARQLLQSLELRQFAPQVTCCPGCGRTKSTYFRELTGQINDYLQQAMKLWRRQRPAAAGLRVAVMGCIVNGPGESRHADVGISLPGTNENPRAPVFVDGKKITTLKGDDIANEFKKIVEQYVISRYPLAVEEDRR